MSSQGKITDPAGFPLLSLIVSSIDILPQIGWNNVRARRENRLLQGMAGGEFFYFNHSYFVVPEEEEVVLAETDYGVIYTSIAGKDNISGVQFHPEKSGRAGLETLENWMRSW